MKRLSLVLSAFILLSTTPILIMDSAFATSGGGSSLDDMTFSLLSLNSQYRSAFQQDKQVLLSSMVSLAQQRERLLQAAIQTDPSAALSIAFSREVGLQFPLQVQQHLEQNVAIQGDVKVLHADDLAHGISTFSYSMQYAGRTVSLYFAGEPPEVSSGSTIFVRGVMVGNSVAISGGPGSLQLIASPLVTLSMRKVAVILFYFQNNPSQPYTQDYARGIVFTNTGSVNSYYQEVSFGQLGLTGAFRNDGDVFGWYTVPYNDTGCPYGTGSSAAVQLAQADGFNPNNYNNVVYAFPSTAGCPGWGWAYINGKESWVTGSFALRVVGHELGHNFGVHHSSSYSCVESGVRVSISASSNCTLSEYGDPFDIMGSSTNHMDNFHKGQLKWFSASNTQDVTANGTYTVSQMEQLSSGVQALRIPRDRDSTGNIQKYYYLEYREPFGFDSFSSTSPVVNGLSIRIAPSYSTITQSWLVDATPGTTSFSDSALAVGATFQDNVYGMVIKSLNRTSTDMTVSIEFGRGACIRSNPTVLVSPSSQWGYPGQALSYSVQVTNRDSSFCPTSTFSIAPTLPGGTWVQSPPSASITLAPGASGSIPITVTPPSDAVVGSYSFSEAATNSGAPSYSTSASATYNVQLPDTTLPTVTINSPKAGAVLPAKGTVKVSVSASDSSGISQIQIIVDGVKVKTCSGVTSCQYTWPVSGLTSGSHTITAVATDKSPAANVASTSITVKK